MLGVSTEFLRECIRSNNLLPFYNSRAWKRLRLEVLIEDHWECQECKKNGRYKRANSVHHVKPVREHPELAMCRHFIDESGKRQRQLLSECDDCHKMLDDHRRRAKAKPLMSDERW